MFGPAVGGCCGVMRWGGAFCLLEALWDPFSAPLPAQGGSAVDHQLGCHRHRIADRTVVEHIVLTPRLRPWWWNDARSAISPHHQEEPVSYPQLLTPEERLADAKRLLSLPRIVVICGSTRFMTEMNEADLRQTKAGKIVVKPACETKSPHELWSGPVETVALKVRLDDLHRAKIRLADEVLVVGNYIGDSTRAEIAYARSLGKPVRFTHPEVDPDA